MTKKDKIIGLLTNETLTSLEISEKLKNIDIEIKQENLWSYLSILKAEGKIKIVNDKKPYKYRAYTPLSFLKQLYDFMSNKCEVSEVDESDIDLLETIEEMIK